MTRFAQMNRFFFPDDLNIFEMVLCFAPFALYVSEEVSVLHATAVKIWGKSVSGKSCVIKINNKYILTRSRSRCTCCLDRIS